MIVRLTGGEPLVRRGVETLVRQLGAVEAVSRAVAEKPQAGSVCSNRTIHFIGG